MEIQRVHIQGVPHKSRQIAESYRGAQNMTIDKINKISIKINFLN